MDNIKEEKKIETDETIEGEPKNKPEVEDESELDKELEESIESVKAGNKLNPEDGEAKAEENKDKNPEDTKPEDTSTPPENTSTVDGEKPKEYEFRIPNKGKFESDESYEMRVRLLDLVNKRKLATTEEKKTEISEEIKNTKSQIKNLNGTDRFINQLNEKTIDKDEKPVETEEEKVLKADKERLKQLGGVTKEELQEVVQQERLATEVKNTLETFVARHPELKNDEDVREVFFDFVDSNYKWQGKNGSELMTVLELARENMFKPSESIQDRVLKSADVQNKVNAMQFPGGTIAKTEYSPEKQESIDELVKTGMSEEEAAELLSD